MTLTQLRYIVAVDKHRSFARAAQDCLVAQPTLSLQIQKLEKEIGTEIFDRRTTPISTTAFGRRVVDQARHVLREADKITELFHENETAAAGNIAIGIIPTISTYLMPKIFLTLRERYPNVDFRVFELPTTQITEKLEKDEIDLGILATPLELKHLVEIPLYYEPFVAYFPENYRGKKTGLRLEDLEGYDLILLGEEHCFRNQSLAVCGNSTVGKIECGSIETIKNLVDIGVGMTLLPLLGVRDKSPRVVRFRDPQPVREVSLVMKKGFYKKKILDALKATILAEIPAEFRNKKNRKLIGVDLPDKD